MNTNDPLTYQLLADAADYLHAKFESYGVLRKGGQPTRLWGIPRGGVPAALLLRSIAPQCYSLVDHPKDADIIVDDLLDSGKTAIPLKQAGNIVGTLLSKNTTVSAIHGIFYGISAPAEAWVTFPWEVEAGQDASGHDIITRLLQFVGEDPARGGLVETPARVMKAWRQWTEGYGIEPKDVLKSFEDGADKVDEMVLLKDIPIYSHCEHHMAPFFGVAHVAYIPSGKIVGLSKLSRLVDIFAHRLQVQERLTNQIADALVTHLKPNGVGVVIECRHMCMESRGIRRAGVTTTTSAMRGALMTKPEARAELLTLLRR